MNENGIQSITPSISVEVCYLMACSDSRQNMLAPCVYKHTTKLNIPIFEQDIYPQLSARVIGCIVSGYAVRPQKNCLSDIIDIIIVLRMHVAGSAKN